MLPVIVDLLAMRLTLSGPTLAVIEPTTTNDLLDVMVNILGTYVIVSVLTSTLAAIEPTALVVMAICRHGRRARNDVDG